MKESFSELHLFYFFIAKKIMLRSPIQTKLIYITALTGTDDSCQKSKYDSVICQEEREDRGQARERCRGKQKIEVMRKSLDKVFFIRMFFFHK